jgi:RNA polymerase sigma-70 factor (ECF subfamily)
MNIFDEKTDKPDLENEASDLSDVDLVNLTIDVDKNYFSQIILRYQKQIFVYILRLLNFHQEDAEDVLATTFLKVYQNLASFNQVLKFSSWIYRIAHNEAVNQIKKNVKNYALDIEKVEFKIDFDDKKLLKIDLEKILNKLNPDDRNLLILYYMEEKSYQEISDILKITVNNVAVKLNRAKIKAKNLYNPNSKTK